MDRSRQHRLKAQLRQNLQRRKQWERQQRTSLPAQETSPDDTFPLPPPDHD